jgi:hypothetical protein
MTMTTALHTIATALASSSRQLADNADNAERRRAAMAASLRQLADLGGEAALAVSTADLSMAFDRLEWPVTGDSPAVTARRATCAELGDLAATCSADGRPSVIAPDAAERCRALWRAWAHIEAGGDPRLEAMRATARREAVELGCVADW